MLVITSNYHTVQEIYAELMIVGKVQLKVWRKKLYIIYQNPNNQQIVLDKYRKNKINNKKVQIYKCQQGTWDIQFGKAKQLYNHQEQIEKYRHNKFSQIIVKKKHVITDSINQFLTKSIKISEKKVDDFNKLRQQQRDHQFKSFEGYLKIKLNKIQTNFTQQIKQFNSLLRTFSHINPTTIQVDPDFQQGYIHNKPIQANKKQIQENIQFINNQKGQLKRLAPINDKNFICSINNSMTNMGFVKIYDSQYEFPKKCISNIESGAYGIACVNKYLLIGTYSGSIRHQCLEQKQLAQSQQRVNPYNNVIFDIKKNQYIGQEFPRIFTVTMSEINCFRLSQEQVTQNIVQLAYQNKKRIQQYGITAFQILNENKICYTNKQQKCLKIYDIENNKFSKTNAQSLKIKNYTENSICLAKNNQIQIIDFRTLKVQCIVKNLVNFIKALEVRDKFIFYGGDRQIGYLDIRIDKNQPIWQNKTTHKTYINDILLLQKTMISGDNNGKIVSWNL